MKQEADGYPRLTLSLFFLAVFLRLLLCCDNPPTNSFDDHYEPVSLIMNTGAIPRKDACFECYNPPVFYSVAAVSANAMRGLGLGADPIQKALQYQNCCYNILTLLFVYQILQKVSCLTALPRLFAFGTVCFLPRHIYMAAMFSNDNLGYLGVAICSYLLLAIQERKNPLLLTALLALAVSLTVFVKYTGFVVLPMVAITFAAHAVRQVGQSRGKPVSLMFLALLPALMLLGSYMATNYRDYGKVLPWNDNFLDTGKIQPRDPEPVNYLSFTPWQYIREPLQLPGQLHSFWTLTYSNTWFDTEPKFLPYTDEDTGWWTEYLTWRREDSRFPESRIPLSTTTRILAGGLLTLGLLALGAVAVGLLRCCCGIASGKGDPARRAQDLPMLVLLAGNVAVVGLLTHKAPVFSSMKASYFLSSLPAFAVFSAHGVQLLCTGSRSRLFIFTFLTALVLFTSVHIVHVACSVRDVILL